MSTADGQSRACPQCAAWMRESGKCWLCGHEVTLEEWAVLSIVKPESESAAGRRPTYRMSTLMLSVALIAVALGLARAAIGLGILFAVIATPAFFRTLMAEARVRKLGQPMGPVEKICVFCGSLGVVVTVAVAGFAAFYATCWATFGLFFLASNDAAFITFLVIGILLGLVVGIYVAIQVARRLWPRHE